MYTVLMPAPFRLGFDVEVAAVQSPPIVQQYSESPRPVRHRTFEDGTGASLRRVLRWLTCLDHRL